MNRVKALIAVVACAALPAMAHNGAGRADSHAPIGVMGDHTHKKGEWMISYRHMEMSMSGNLQGSGSISDDEIATTIPNRFAGMPGMPPTLRIVPQTMETKMDMLGFMYAPSDRVTLMAMINYVSKDMELLTYQGGMGTDQLGRFNTSSSGLGDTSLGALVTVFKSGAHTGHINLGLSLPTGDITQRDTILTPMNMRPEVRLPYAMQLGSGTYDFSPGFTYNGRASSVSWGAQYIAKVRLSENDEGYTLGDVHEINAWGQYLFSPAVSIGLRLNAKNSGKIDGADDEIMGPVQTADPDNYGGEQVNLGFALNLLGQSGWVAKHRLALEYLRPLSQDVNGVQMEMDDMFTIGYQYAF